ncbi:MAG: hydroxyethylthiazole kinase [Tissierellia bacterium]|nr:hydroxyethylthiazole kinase [Tissierellia bacterium]
MMLKSFNDFDSPLIHHITNYVSANESATACLAVGGNPIMADDVADAPYFTKKAKALVLNMGIFSASKEKAMILCDKIATERGIPIVLDAVAIDISERRMKTFRMLMKRKKNKLVKMNRYEFDELLRLSDLYKYDYKLREQLVCALARKYGVTIVVTGKRDIISDGTKTISLNNGTELLNKRTAVGGMVSTLIATMATYEKDLTEAAVWGLSLINCASEIAEQKMEEEGGGMSSFNTYLIDEIYNMDMERLKKLIKRTDH